MGGREDDLEQGLLQAVAQGGSAWGARVGYPGRGKRRTAQSQVDADERYSRERGPTEEEDRSAHNSTRLPTATTARAASARAAASGKGRLNAFVTARSS